MLAALLFAASVSAGAPDVAGLWLTPTDAGVVKISHCGASLCAELLTSNKIKRDASLKDSHNQDQSLRGRTLKGLELFQDFKGAGGSWTDGRIYNPDDGGTYHATIELQGGDQLKLVGCIFAPLCKTQIWRRLPPDAAP
jgi:uncharacterized protein (DUF2147 family)